MTSIENNINRPPSPVSTPALFLSFLSAGGLTLGGGYALISPMRRTLCEKNRWMSEDDFERHLAVVQAMPGVFNVNFAVYFGRVLAGAKGQTVCTLAMVLPALLVFLLFATFYEDFRTMPWLQGFLRGARPAIAALILLPALQMLRRSAITLSTVWIPVGVAVAVGLLGVSPTYIIAAFVLIGLAYGFFVHG